MADNQSISAFFTENGTPKTGLTPTIDIWLSDGSKKVNSDNMVEVGGGFYSYTIGGFENDINFFIRADGGDSLPTAERFVFAVNEPVGGGGLSITGDMMFTLKKMSDNIATKDDIKTFIGKITNTIINIENNITEKEIESKKKVSKMNADIKDKIDLLITQDNNLNTKRDTDSIKSSIKLLKTDLEGIDKTLKSNTQEWAKMLEMNKIMKGLILSIDNKEDLIKVRGQLNNNEKGIESIKKDIQGTDKTKELAQIDKTVNSLMDNIQNIPKEISANLMPLQSEITSKFKEESHKQSKINTGLKNNFDDMNNKLKLLSNQLISRKTELEANQKELINKLINLENSLKNKSDKDNETIIHFRDDIQSELGSMNLNINSLNKMKQNLKDIQEELESMNLKSAHKKDIRFISNDFNNKLERLYAKISESSTNLKNGLIKLNRNSKSKRKDDTAEVMEQMRMLEKEEHTTIINKPVIESKTERIIEKAA